MMKMVESVEELEQRVRRLARRLAATTVVALGATVASGWMLLSAAGGQSASILRVRGLVIEDDEGRSRILLGAPVPGVPERKREDRSTALIVVDEKGVDRLVLGYQLDPQVAGHVVDRISAGVGINVNDGSGNERGGFGYLDTGRVVLGLDFAEGRGEGIAAAVVDGGYAAVVINDESGARERGVLYVGKGGDAALKLLDAQARGGMLVKTPPEGSPRLLRIDAETREMTDVLSRE